MHEISPLISLTELAVGFGRKRDALDPDTRSWRDPSNSPQRPEKEIKYSCVHSDQYARRYRFPRSPEFRRLSETVHEIFGYDLHIAASYH